jgi:hypothetical protein
MKKLVPVPGSFVEQLKEAKETGIGYHVVSVDLKDGRHFDQVATSEGHIIEVRGFKEIPFSQSDVAAMTVNHKRWNFRDSSDSREKSKAATA